MTYFVGIVGILGTDKGSSTLGGFDKSADAHAYKQCFSELIMRAIR